MTDLKSPSHPSTAVSEASEQKSPQTMPLKRYAALCLLLLGVVFYASYGFANWLSAQRVEDDAAHLTVGALETLARAGASLS